MRIVTLLLAALAIASCKVSAAQGIPDDPIAPVKCFEIADAKQLSGQSAQQLCTGALSEAPGRCFANATDQLSNFSEQQILQLCAGATDMEPFNCAARLDAAGDTTEDQTVSFCATRCAMGPPPTEVNNSACMAVATNEAGLALQTAGELCTGARSAGPAECVIAGERLTTLASSKLVDMCTESRRCQYFNAAPVSSY